MSLSFLVPDLYDRPTGGNIYNRRLLTELHESHTVERHVWTPNGAPLPIDPSPDTVVVVDSLLVRHPEALRTLRDAHSDGPLVLLAHYLHCVDPQEHVSAAAATERKGLPLFDGAVTPSRYVRQALTEEGLPPGRVDVVPPGLDEAFRAPGSAPTSDPPRLLTVANWLPGKGLPTLLDQLSGLAELDWSWTLVGDDTLDPAFADAVRDRLSASPIASRVTARGPVPPSEMPAQYDQADLLVLPSRFETCSMATREAMARGRPVVGYAVGGLPENFGEAAAGRLVPPGQPDAFGDALRTLLTEPSTRATMGRAARRQSRSFPTWTDTARRFWSFVQSLQ